MQAASAACMQSGKGNYFMHIIIFNGFLGSGKTSLILSLAEFIIRQEESPGRTDMVIVENEIGETGIDNKVLQNDSYSVKELFSGCICCTLSSDLVSALNQISEDFDPKHVIVECTGLAYPANIVSVINKYVNSLSSVRAVTVVDAERWEMLFEYTPVLLESQTAEGDIILINKADAADADSLRSLTDKISEINSRAPVFQVSAENGIDDAVWHEVLK